MAHQKKLTQKQVERRQDAAGVLVIMAVAAAAGRKYGGQQRYTTMLRRTLQAAGFGACVGFVTGLLEQVIEPQTTPDPRVNELAAEIAFKSGAAVYALHMIAAAIRW